MTGHHQPWPADIPSFGRCFARLVAVKLSLKVRGLGPTLTRCTQLWSDIPHDDAISDAVIDQVAYRVAGAAALFPGRALCLERTLVLHSELRRLGVESRIRFGILPLPFNAHVWVEVRGRAINENLHWLSQMMRLEA